MAIVTVAVESSNNDYKNVVFYEYDGDGNLLSTYWLPPDQTASRMRLLGATPDYGLLVNLAEPQLTTSFPPTPENFTNVIAYTSDFVNFSPVGVDATLWNVYPDDEYSSGLRTEEGTQKYVRDNLLSNDGGATWFAPALTPPAPAFPHTWVLEDLFVTVPDSTVGSLATSADGLTWNYLSFHLMTLDGLGNVPIVAGGKTGSTYYVVDGDGAVYTAPSLAGPYDMSLPVVGYQSSWSIGVRDGYGINNPICYTYGGRSFIVHQQPFGGNVDIFEVTPTAVNFVASFRGMFGSPISGSNVAFAEGKIYSVRHKQLGIFQISDLSLTYAPAFDDPASQSFCGFTPRKAYVSAIPGSSRTPGGGSLPLPVIPPPFWRDHTVTYELP